MGRDTVQLETAVSTISQEYLLEFTSEYGISEDLHPELPSPEERIVDFIEGKVDLFNLIRAPSPTKVKTGTRPRVAHEVPLLTVTASHVIEMEDPTTATDSFRVPSTTERSPLDFSNENLSQQSTGGNRTEDQGQETVAPEVPSLENITTTGVAPEAGLAEEIAAMGPRVIKERRKRGNGVDTNAPPKVLRRDHADSQPTQSTVGGKSLAATGLGMGSTFPVSTSQKTPVDVSDPNPLSFANPQSSKGATVAGDPESKNTSFASMVGSPKSIYQAEWGVTNECRLDAPEACQDLVDHLAPQGYFLELHHLHNDNFFKQYNINLARKTRENEIKNLEALLEAETDMKKTTKDKNAELGKELENLCALFSDLQVSNDRLSQQVSTLQAQVTGEGKLKAAFEEFKQYEDDRVEKRCAEMDARLDALSIDFDEELYPHMLTTIACHRWVIEQGLRLVVMKCGESTELRKVFADVVSAGIAKGISEGLKYGVEHEKANLDLEAIEAYDSEAETKYVAALHVLRDLKYPMVDQLELLKDALIDVVMASLHLESDSGEDAP
uniref:Transposase (Putative), gypsy type n=1 Tax=Tanacetum cinerariifolium TaxID=118510 RepID=A0A699I1I0_TANCI|nr:hypothetical protein [Tanacetum cinerariifolium]